MDVDEIAWWENVGGAGTSWIKHIIDDQYHQAQCVYSEDVDNDGDMDVVGAAAQVGGIYWWENLDGSAEHWAQHLLVQSNPGTYSLYSSDIDGS